MTGKAVASFLEEDGGFPDDKIFNTLLPIARELDHIVFHDPAKDINANYDQLITDVIHMRHKLREQLSRFLDPQNNSIFAESVLICTLAPANYEYAVATFAILALGGTVVPLPTNTSPKLFIQYLRRNPVKYILTGSDFREQASEYQAFCNQNFLPAIDIQPISIMNSCPEWLWSSPNLKIMKGVKIPESRAGIVLFSSGSTGTPKGVIHNRDCIASNKPRLSPEDRHLLHRPASWLGGTMPMTRVVLGGARAEVIDPSAPIEEYWERLRTDRITTVISTVVLWEKLARHYKTHLKTHPDRDSYLAGISNLRTAVISASVPIPSLLRFYREEIDKPLVITYGSTEMGKVVLGMSAEEEGKMKEHRGIGRPLYPSHPAKLSDGDSGELLIGGLTTFMGYLNDDTGAKALIDEEGFLHTGDICHKIGEYFFFDGRASADFIKTPGGPVPVCQLEEIVQKLKYFKDAYVVPVEDKVIGRRVGVIARPVAEAVNIERLRNDLAPLVSPHMLPTAFRSLDPDEVIPLTYTDKIAKTDIMKHFFPCDAEGNLPSAVEVIDIGFQ